MKVYARGSGLEGVHEELHVLKTFLPCYKTSKTSLELAIVRELKLNLRSRKRMHPRIFQLGFHFPEQRMHRCGFPTPFCK
jgi:hypothetical protein